MDLLGQRALIFYIEKSYTGFVMVKVKRTTSDNKEGLWFEISLLTQQLDLNIGSSAACRVAERMRARETESPVPGRKNGNTVGEVRCRVETFSSWSSVGIIFCCLELAQITWSSSIKLRQEMKVGKCKT